MKKYFLQYGTEESAFENWTTEYDNLDDAVNDLAETIVDEGITDNPFEEEDEEEDYDNEWREWVKEQVKKNGSFVMEEVYNAHEYEIVIGITDEEHYRDIADILDTKRKEWLDGYDEDEDEE